MRAETVDWREIARLGATNSRLFARAYFPRTFRDPFPPFFNRIWNPLESPKVRFANFQLFRGSSKTTNSRVFAAKRIAYGQSKLILIICASETKAKLTIRWLKAAVQRNRQFAHSFGLKPGKPWTDTELQILRDNGDTINVIGLGITGSTRGLNVEDYRPDFILVDDVLDDDTAASVTQRTKMEDLILGALAKSLATLSDNPNAKMAVLQTPFNHDDFSMKAFQDPMWYSVRQGCWTFESENRPIDSQESAWEERFPSEILRNDKKGYIARNKASIFSREMECKLVTPETSAFRHEWIRFWDENTLPPLHQMQVVMAIDPVPPPTEAELQKSMHKKNFEVLACVGYHQGKYYILEYRMNRGHEPNWTIATFFELLHKWKPKKLEVEAHGYQSTLAWLLKSAMASQGKYIPVHEERDSRSKYDKIVDPLAGPASQGALLFHPSMHDAISNFGDYPNVEFDDLLEAIAKAVEGLLNFEVMDGELSGYGEDAMGQLEYFRGAP